ncbi:MAG: hypothetical protein CL967_08135 [Euryarchaeota archaeon]|nr:hypothetical protein [Euryarchaeota archaeon]
MTVSVAITEYRNAASLSSDNARMDVEINHPDFGWIPYTIDPADTDMTIDNSALLALIGSDFTAYVAPTQEELDAATAAEVRNERNRRLVSEVDPIVSNPLRWGAMSEQEQANMSAYRMALLDVPQQAGFPNTVSWPSLA